MLEKTGRVRPDLLRYRTYAELGVADTAVLRTVFSIARSVQVELAPLVRGGSIRRDTG
jgi:hypothetical protein